MEAESNNPAFTLTVGQMHDLMMEVVKEALQRIEPPKEESVKYLTRVEACEELHISLPTLSRYMDLGVVVGQKVGNRILISKENIQNALHTIPTRKHNK